MLVLSKADIYRALDWKEAVTAVGRAFAALSTGRASVPLRTGFELPPQDGLLLLMPGALHSETHDQLAVKLVSVFNRNPARNLPLIYGLVTLFEADTGRPLAVLEGGSLTAIRTGAASGVASQYLAAPQARVLTIFGAGVQAYTQGRAIVSVREDSIQEVRVVGRDALKARHFVDKLGAEIGRPVRLLADVGDALAGADIVATATTSLTPVFEDGQLWPGVHINGVGSYQPISREVPGRTVERARLVVDARASALSEAGDVIIPLEAGVFGPEHIYAELGEIVAEIKPGRASFGGGEISFFKSVGNAAQDVAIAHYIYNKAQQLGIGTLVEL